jgi:glucose/mannose-6-phosphate isomerase
MRDLDTSERFAALDPKGMLSCIRDLPWQCEDGWAKVHQLAIPETYGHVDEVVILGMGGSGIGGDLLRGLLLPECRVPIIVHRDYGLPAHVGEHSLVIACSYSGNTEETLLGFGQAVERGARVVSVTTGGELARRSTELGVPVCRYEYETQPRAALGYSLAIPLGILEMAGLIGHQSEDVAESVAVMRAWQEEIKETVPVAENPAKMLATQLYGRLPVIYGAEHLSEVTRRWKGQFNENSKSWAVFDVLPELNHNTVAGYALPGELAELATVLMLTSEQYHPRVQLRFDITRELLQQNGFAWKVIEARGRSMLAQMLSVIGFGDYVSYYLAMLNDVDPWSIGNIDLVKRRLEAS